MHNISFVYSQKGFTAYTQIANGTSILFHKYCCLQIAQKFASPTFLLHAYVCAASTVFISIT